MSNLGYLLVPFMFDLLIHFLKCFRLWVLGNRILLSGVIPTVKVLSEIYWRKIRALTCNLHQFIHNFKSHTPLQRFAWYIAGLVLHLLKQPLNYRLAKSLTRKMWIRFLERLIMLNNGFHKIWPWVRHIGSSCKLIYYLKTVEFSTLKTSQCKEGRNADSQKYTFSWK